MSGYNAAHRFSSEIEQVKAEIQEIRVQVLRLSEDVKHISLSMRIIHDILENIISQK